MNKSLVGYPCHELHRVLMDCDRVDNWFYYAGEWQVTENYGMDVILPHVGGTVFCVVAEYFE